MKYFYCQTLHQLLQFHHEEVDVSCYKYCKCSWKFSLCGLNLSCSSHKVTINLAYDSASLVRRDEHDLWFSGWTRWIRSAWRVITANFLITSALSVSVAFIKSYNCIWLTCSFIHSGFFFGSLAVSRQYRPCLSEWIKVDWSLRVRSALNTCWHMFITWCGLSIMSEQTWCTDAALSYRKVLKIIL